MKVTQASRRDRFEQWLTIPRFAFVVGLLLLLNALVWIGQPNRTSAINGISINSLREERARILSMLDAACDDLWGRALSRSKSLQGDSTTPRQIASETGLENESLATKLNDSTVLIVHPKGIGSGFFINRTTVVTNRHVVESASDADLTIVGHSLNGPVKGRIVSATSDSKFGNADFAVIKLVGLTAEVSPLAIASGPKPLQKVIAVGYPGSGIDTDRLRNVPAPIFTAGVVSAVQPQRSGVELVVHTADISPGSSGGVLADECGNVVGVNTFVRASDNSAESKRMYALSSQALRQFLSSAREQFVQPMAAYGLPTDADHE